MRLFFAALAFAVILSGVFSAPLFGDAQDYEAPHLQDSERTGGSWGDSNDKRELNTAQVLPDGLVPCGRSSNDPNTPEIENAPCTFCHFFILLSRIVNWIVILITPITAILFIVIGGFLILVSRGNATMYNRGRNFIVWALIGIAVMLAAWVLVNAFLTTVNVTRWTGLGEWWKLECEIEATTSPSLPTVNLQADRASLVLGEQLTLSWVVTDAVSCRSSSSPNDTINWGRGDPKSNSGGDKTFAPESAGNILYELECSNSTGIAIDSVSVNVSLAEAIPVAHWNFNDGVGSILRDVVGVNNGNISGATWAEGKEGVAGTALQFNGTSDYVEVPHNASLQTTNEMTVAVCMSPSFIPLPEARHHECRDGGDNDEDGMIDFPGDPGCNEQHDDSESLLGSQPYSGGVDQGILTKGTAIGTAEENYSLTLRGAKIRFRPCYDSDGNGQGDDCAEATGGTISAGVWNHIIAIYSRNVISKIYINGISAGTNTALDVPLISSTSPLRIGGGQTAQWHSPFSGRIDDIKIWNTALTATQVASETVALRCSGTALPPPVAVAH